MPCRLFLVLPRKRLRDRPGILSVAIAVCLEPHRRCIPSNPRTTKSLIVSYRVIDISHPQSAAGLVSNPESTSFASRPTSNASDCTDGSIRDANRGCPSANVEPASRSLCRYTPGRSPRHSLAQLMRRRLPECQSRSQPGPSTELFAWWSPFDVSQPTPRPREIHAVQRSAD
jgi:hypothetical protein